MRFVPAVLELSSRITPTSGSSAVVGSVGEVGGIISGTGAATGGLGAVDDNNIWYGGDGGGDWKRPTFAPIEVKPIIDILGTPEIIAS